MAREIPGVPGTTVDLTVLHNGTVETIYPIRISAKLIAAQDMSMYNINGGVITNPNYFQQLANQTNSW